MKNRTRSWKEIPRNPYLQSLDVRMLLPEGLLIKKKIRLKGDFEEDSYCVRYDSEFVIQYLRKNVIDRMPTLTSNDWEVLIARAMLPRDKDESTPFFQSLSINHEEN